MAREINPQEAFRYFHSISFQFHHTQMDGVHAGRFMENLQNEIHRCGFQENK